MSIQGKKTATNKRTESAGAMAVWGLLATLMLILIALFAAYSLASAQGNNEVPALRPEAPAHARLASPQVRPGLSMGVPAKERGWAKGLGGLATGTWTQIGETGGVAVR